MTKRRAAAVLPAAIQTLIRDKLASSGLTEADMTTYGFVGRTAAQTVELNPALHARSCIHIPYFDPFGRPLSDWTGCPQFYRVRYLDGFTSAQALTNAETVRYMQPPNTLPAVYYPKSDDWPSICADVNRPLIITEGEFKAAKAMKEGFPTIGLGGVNSWRAMKMGVTWLKSFDFITWPTRNVYICFDSDFVDNKNIQKAIMELSDELARHGARPHLVRLPDIFTDGRKTGLDDFLAVKDDHTEYFRRVLAEAQLLTIVDALYDFNRRFVYVRDPGLVIELKTESRYAPRHFIDFTEAKLVTAERRVAKDGSLSYEHVSAAAAWMKWPLRNDVAKITYVPGSPREVIVGDMPHYNMWSGWGVEPKKGPVKLFLQLVDHLFTGADPQAKTWFLQWCAYPLQHPGIKLFSSVAIHGHRHGTGKSYIGYTLGRIYGRNFSEINQNDLHSSFNEWAQARQFVLGDDVTGPNKRQESDVLKKMITQRELRINSKYVPSFVVPDCINYYFTSNHPDAFFLEDDDRRFFIHEVLAEPLGQDFYAEYGMWLGSGGAAAIFHYLLNLPTDDFNPTAPAFRTLAKEQMIADGQSDLGSWVRLLKTSPDAILKLNAVPLKRDCYTAKELLMLYDPTGHTKTTANGMARELRRAGIPLLNKGVPITLPDGLTQRYYIVRRATGWITAAPSAIIKHVMTDLSVSTTTKY